MDHRFNLIAPLAMKWQIGTVGLAGSHATGTADPLAPVEVFVTVPLESAPTEDLRGIPRLIGFAEELALEMECAVHLYDPHALPFAHPLHFAVRWLNVTTLPRVRVPLGATLRCLNGSPVCIPLAQIPHFAEAEGPPPTPRGRALLVVPAPPPGAFLI